MNAALELAKRRYSCRDYLPRPLTAADRDVLTAVLDTLTTGPFGNRCRLGLIAATQEDRDALKGLGTYGFIRGATGFLAGAVTSGPGNLEDYGYCLEQAVLKATELGLGTCWLGGTFGKSSFAKKVALKDYELLPAVAAVGYPTESAREHWIRRRVRGDDRLPAARLFFADSTGTPRALGPAGAYPDVLDAVRWAPSASNKQPWRLLRQGEDWHFYLERTPGYRKGVIKSLIGLADLQRVDMGIAMCHFKLAAREAGLSGGWVVRTPPPETGAPDWEYTASWVTG